MPGECTLDSLIFLCIQGRSLKTETTVITYHALTTLYSLQNRLAPITLVAVTNMRGRQDNDYYSYLSDQRNEGREMVFF